MQHLEGCIGGKSRNVVVLFVNNKCVIAYRAGPHVRRWAYCATRVLR